MSFIGDAISSITNPIFGKPDSDTQESAANASSDYTRLLSQMTGDYYNKTGGLRNTVIGNLENFMNGNYDPTESAMYAPLKASAEQQYGTAKDSIMSELPQGGALLEGLANLQGQKANTLSTLLAQLVQDEYNKAYATGTGSQATAASGITNAVSGSNSLLSALAQQQGAGAASANASMSSVAKVIASLLA